MGKVVSHMTMSLDGFIADPHDGVGELFGWYEAGAVTVPSADEHMSFRVDERSRLPSLGSIFGLALCEAMHKPLPRKRQELRAS